MSSKILSNIFRETDMITRSVTSKYRGREMAPAEMANMMDRMGRMASSMNDISKMAEIQHMEQLQRVGVYEKSSSRKEYSTSTQGKSKVVKHPDYKFECFISNNVLILFIDTPELDIVQIPMTEVINLDTTYQGKRLRIQWGDRNLTFEDCELSAKEMMIEIRKVITEHYKKLKREFK